MPRFHRASAKGPSPSRTSSVSSSDSARCTAIGKRSRRASAVTALYKAALTVKGACGETPSATWGVANGSSRERACSSSSMLVRTRVGSGPNTS